jgi:hypothetical protein
MNIMNYIIFAMFLSFLSCENTFSCKDEKLSLNRTENSGQELRMDGFYFGNPESDWENTVLFETFVFYYNGVLLQTGIMEFDNMESEIEGLSKTSLPQQSKDAWGIIYINGSNISIEHWLPSRCSKPAVLREGEILNDTTFVLKKMVRRDSEGTTETDIVQEFHFRQFDIKPDSTNNFFNI